MENRQYLEGENIIFTESDGQDFEIVGVYQVEESFIPYIYLLNNREILRNPSREIGKILVESLVTNGYLSLITKAKEQYLGQERFQLFGYNPEGYYKPMDIEKILE